MVGCHPRFLNRAQDRRTVVNDVLHGWGVGFVAIAVLMFGFTCLLLYFRVRAR